VVDVSLYRHFQRTGKCLEDAFYLMMLVLALSLDVEVHLCRITQTLEELYCRIDERNTASVRLAKKLGFTNSGNVDDDINASIYRKNIKNNEKH
jgi:L-amino acid N-acyltransferase YncA